MTAIAVDERSTLRRSFAAQRLYRATLFRARSGENHAHVPEFETPL